jgi:hypothetical protein
MERLPWVQPRNHTSAPISILACRAQFFGNVFDAVKEQRWLFLPEGLLIVLPPAHRAKRYASRARGARVPNFVPDIKHLPRRN